MTKHCNGCGETKPLSEFYVRKGGGYESRCKACSKARAGEWRTRNAERSRAISRHYRDRDRERYRRAQREAARRKRQDPEKLATIRVYDRERWRRKHGITPDRYRVREGARRSDLVDVAPVRASVLASGLPITEIAERAGRDEANIRRSLQAERMEATKAAAILAAIDVLPAEVGL